MTTIPQETPLGRRRTSFVGERDMWASIAITAIWLSVTLGALFGPDIVSNTPGGTYSRVPSAIVIAFFATIATWLVARYGFRRNADT